MAAAGWEGVLSCQKPASNHSTSRPVAGTTHVGSANPRPQCLRLSRRPPSSGAMTMSSRSSEGRALMLSITGAPGRLQTRGACGRSRRGGEQAGWLRWGCSRHQAVWTATRHSYSHCCCYTTPGRGVVVGGAAGCPLHIGHDGGGIESEGHAVAVGAGWEGEQALNRADRGCSRR